MYFLLVKKPVILVQIENITVTEALDVLADIYNLLKVLVLTIVEDRIVDDNAVNAIIMIRSQYMTFEFFAVNLSQLEFNVTDIASEMSKSKNSRDG